MNFNEDFFETIDTEEKAYWLGFLYADGCIVNSRKKWTIQIELSRKDEKHLEKFHKSINLIKKIYQTAKVTQNNKYCEYSTTHILCEKMCQDLINHGCIQRKALKIIYPNISKELNNHFIRGYFDGDGGWVIRQRKTEFKQISAKITSTKEFLLKIKDICNLNGSVRAVRGKNHPSYNKNTQQIAVEGNKQCKKFYEFIYKNATIFLDRKKEQADLHFKDCENRNFTKKTDKLYTAFGETKSLRLWSNDKRCIVSYNTLYARIKNGVLLEKALVKESKKWKMNEF